MLTYEQHYAKLRKELLEACDDRLQKLDDLGWSRLEAFNECDELPEDLGETAVWIAHHGYHSVKHMIDTIIWKVEQELNLSLMDEGIVVRCEKGEDGYYLPRVEMVASLDGIENYWVGSTCLVSDYARKCWKALPESDRNYLESLDWDDLSEKDERDICDGKYDVEITVDSNGNITFRHYWCE